MIFEGWGIAASSGVVRPANLEDDIYWTDYVIHASSPKIVGTPIHVMHDTRFEPIGETTDYSVFEDNLFIKYKIYEHLWNNFVSEANSKENINIGTTFNQLVSEIESGNMALSVGVDALTAPTKRHPRTVVALSSWNEVSLVRKPASPGSWTAACTDKCQEAFR